MKNHYNLYNALRALLIMVLMVPLILLGNTSETDNVWETGLYNLDSTTEGYYANNSKVGETSRNFYLEGPRLEDGRFFTSSGSFIKFEDIASSYSNNTNINTAPFSNACNITVNAGNDITIYKGETVALFASVTGVSCPGGEAKYYRWLNIDNFDEEYAGNAINVTPSVTTTYEVVAVDCDTACQALDYITVTVNEMPVDAGDDTNICEGESTELTASMEGEFTCPGGCEYIVQNNVPLCDGRNFDANINGKFFSASSNSKFSSLENGTANFTTTFTGNNDIIEVDITFGGYTTTPPQGSPYVNSCGDVDSSDWVYYRSVQGTFKSRNHGTFKISRRGGAFQLGTGADTRRKGFGLGGWFHLAGGDGTYYSGDVIIPMNKNCTPFNATSTIDYVWSTQNGSIVGDANQQIVTVDKGGVYTVTATNCAGVETTDQVTVSIRNITVNAGNDVTINKGESVALSATVTGVSCAGGEAKYYRWLNIDNFDEEYAGNAINVTPSVTTTYEVVAVDCDTACQALDYITVTVNEMPVDAGDDTNICEGESTELTASMEGEFTCPGGCEYIVQNNVPLCDGRNFDANINGKFFSASSNSKFSSLENGTANFTTTFTGNNDIIEVDITFGGYTTTPPQGSPYVNSCGDVDSSDWVYYRSVQGTFKSRNHGTFKISRRGGAFQLGTGADTRRKGFGLGGWFHLAGGDGTYYSGDVIIPMNKNCTPFNATSTIDYVWSTQNGSIVGDANQQIVTVDKGGVYTVTATNCAGVETTDQVTVSIRNITVNAGNDVTINKGESVALSATVTGVSCAGGEAKQYIWTNVADFSEQFSGNAINVTPSVTTTYEVVAVDCDTACQALDYITVTVNEIPVDAGDDTNICEGESTELTASMEGEFTCPGGCEYIVQNNVPLCDGRNFDANINGKFFSASSNSKFSSLENGTANFTTTFTGNNDIIEVDITFGGYTTTPPQGSPYVNSCGDVDSSDWVYYRSVQGTFKSRNHGTFKISRRGGAFQLGTGADTRRKGFGLGGWFHLAGGDGTYYSGDVIIPMNKNCTPFNATSTIDYVWSTQNGSIVGDANQQIVTVDKGGVYTVTATNCAGVETTDQVTVIEDEKISIGDLVWVDADRDGIQDPNEVGINNINVQLYQCNDGDNSGGTLVDSTTTANNGAGEPGAFNFEVCPNSGEYYVVFSGLPDDYEFSSTDQGNDATDSDANESGVTNCFEVIEENISTIDAGINLPKGSLGNLVFNDKDNDGVQDAGEEGVAGVTVTLFTCDETQIATTITDANGNYLFADLEPNTEYYVVFSNIPNGYVFSPANQGGNDATDSDVNNNGRTDCVEIGPGESNLTVDAGINLPKGSLGNLVFDDKDNDGVQDAGEEGVAGVTVTLFTCDETEVATTTTDANGNYLFADLEPNTEYYVVFSNIPDGYVFSPANQGGDDATDSDANSNGRTDCVEIGPGESNQTVDAGINLPKGSLGNLVFDDKDNDGVQDAGEEGVSGVTVTLFTCDETEVATTTTDANGNYLFADLEPNTEYYVVFSNIPDGYVFSPANQGGDDATDSDANSNGRTDCVEIGPGESNQTVDAGINLPKGSLGNLVFDDKDNDGVQDAGEEGVSGVTVTLFTCDETQIATTITDANGNYLFADLEPNTEYYVVFSNIPNGYVFSSANQGGNDATDSDVNNNGRTDCVEIGPGESNLTVDAGIHKTCTIDPSVTKLEDPICKGTEITLTAQGGDQFVWKLNNEVIEDETSATLIVTPEQTSTYSVVVTDSSQFECFGEVSTTITVNPVTPDATEEVTVCSGADYVWPLDGKTYTAVDSPVAIQIEDANGCSYMATLTIKESTVVPDVTEEVTVCSGADYVWPLDGKTYTAADSPVAIQIEDANGCSYMATLTITESTVVPDVTEEVTVCSGADYVWPLDGKTYTAVDSPVAIQIEDANGCSYMATLTIKESTVVPDVTEEVTVCSGADYVWPLDGKTYTAADSPVAIQIEDANGCSYMATLTITESTVVPDVTEEVTVCSGADYVWPLDGKTYTAADSPVAIQIEDANGCSYMATLTITESKVVPDVTEEVTVCSGADYVWPLDGKTYTAADSPVAIQIEDANGCSYMATLTITESTVVPDVTEEVTVCSGADYVWPLDGKTYTASDSPVAIQIEDANGCSYMATLTITESTVVPDVTEEVTVCSGADYVWPLDGKTYTASDSPVAIQIEDANGCSYMATLTITESTVVPDVTEEVTVCSGADYVWPLDGKTYTASDSPVAIQIEDANGCSYMATLTITESTVVPDVTEEVTVCSGADYVWPLDGKTYTASDSPVAIQIEDANGCSYMATLTITESTVVPDVTEEVTVCSGADYVWPLDGKTYTAADSPVAIQIEDANGCSYIATLTIKEYDVTDDVTEEVTVCSGADYVWPLDGKTYTAADCPVAIQIEDANGCSYMATLTIIEDNDVIVSAGDDLSICEGESVTLTATGGGKYLWSNGATTASIEVSPSETIEYWVTVVSDSGCTAEDGVIITVNPLPNISAGEDVEISAGGETTLTVTGIEPGDSIIWYPGGKTTESITVSPKTDTSYVVEVTSANGCQTSDKVKVTIALCELDLKIQYMVDPDNDDFVDGNEAAAYISDNFHLRIVDENGGGDFSGWNFIFDLVDGTSMTQTSNSFCLFDVDEEDFGTYIVHWVSPEGCKGMFEVELKKEDKSIKNKNGARITSIFPIPATASSSVTVTIDIPSNDGSKTSDKGAGTSGKFSALLPQPENKTEVWVSLYDFSGRLVQSVRRYEIKKGVDSFKYNIEFLPAGNYILKIDSVNWRDSKNIIVK